MANTVFQHKRSGTPSNVPSALELGELAINYADGLIFYKNTTDHIVSISGSGGGNAFGTVNANGTLVVADTPGDVLNLVAGTNVTFSVDAVNDIITINATGGSGDVSAPFAAANAAFLAANSAFANGNTTHTLTIAAFSAANASFANGNTNFGVLQVVSGVANASFSNGNTTHTLTISAFGAANSAFANGNTNFGTTVAAFSVANSGIIQANTARDHANNAFAKANNALANTSDVSFNGNLNFPTGNVGIGTATPNHALHIVRTGGTIPALVIEGDGEQTFRFLNANTTPGAGTRVSWKLANRWNTDWQYIWYTDTTSAGANNIVLAGQGTGGTQTLFYGDANTGNVAIGKTTADYKLDVAGSVNASALLVNGSPISGGGLSYTSNVGDAVANTFNITHALNSTTIIPAVREISTGYYVYPDMKMTSPNNIVIEFVSIPTANQYFLIVLGV